MAQFNISWGGRLLTPNDAWTDEHLHCLSNNNSCSSNILVTSTSLEYLMLKISTAFWVKRIISSTYFKYGEVAGSIETKTRFLAIWCSILLSRDVMCACTPMHTYTRTHRHRHKHTQTHTYACTQTQTHIDTDTHTRTHAHTHICDRIWDDPSSTHNYKYLEILTLIIWNIIIREGKMILKWNFLQFYSYL